MTNAARNVSGITPLDLKILIKPDPVEEVSKGGIIMAPTATERAKFAQTKATVVAIGCNAFRDWGAQAAKPSAGSRVIIGQYSGARTKGVDGEEYVVCEDKDVLAIIEGEAA